MKTINFDLDDCDGNPHKYAVQLFSCDENIALQLIMGDILAGPLGQVVGAVAAAFAGREPGEEFKLADAVGRVDWGGAGLSIQNFARSVESREGPKLVARVFEHTTRERVELDGEGAEHKIPDSLAKPFGRDMAFGDGNYLELWKAFVAVLAVNFGPFGRTGSLSLNEILSSLTGGLLTPLNPSTGMTPPNSAAGSVANVRPS